MRTKICPDCASNWIHNEFDVDDNDYRAIYRCVECNAKPHYCPKCGKSITEFNKETGDHCQNCCECVHSDD